MSMWLSNHPCSLAPFVADRLRACISARCRWRVPPTLRRAQAQVVRLITVVAGH